MKVKQLLEQLKYITKGVKVIAPILLIVPLEYYGLNFLEKQGLLKEFFGTLFVIAIIFCCHILGKSSE